MRMSGFFGIIFYVIIIGFFISAKNSAQKMGNQGKSSKRNQSPELPVNRKKVMSDKRIGRKTLIL